MSRRSRYYLAKSADTGKCGNKAGLPSTVGVSLAQRRSFMSNLQWKQPCCKPKKCEISRFRKTPLEDPMSDVKIANVEYTGATQYRTFKVTLTDDLKNTLDIVNFEIKVDGTAIVANVNGTPTVNELSFDLNQNMFLEAAGAELSVKLLDKVGGVAVEDSKGHELDTQVEVKKQLTPDITYSLLGLNKGALPATQHLTITLIAGGAYTYSNDSLLSVDLNGVNYPLVTPHVTDVAKDQQFDVTLDYSGKSMTDIESLFPTAANVAVTGTDSASPPNALAHTLANAVPAYENYLSFFVNFSKPVGNNSNLPLEKENLRVLDQNSRALVISKLEYVGDHLSSGVTYKVTLGSITNTGNDIILNVEQNVNGVFIHHFKNGVAVTEGNGGIVSQTENAQETI